MFQQQKPTNDCRGALRAPDGDKRLLVSQDRRIERGTEHRMMSRLGLDRSWAEGASRIFQPEPGTYSTVPLQLVNSTAQQSSRASIEHFTDNMGVPTRVSFAAAFELFRGCGSARWRSRANWTHPALPAHAGLPEHSCSRERSPRSRSGPGSALRAERNFYLTCGAMPPSRTNPSNTRCCPCRTRLTW